jgi:hypothetical protein
VSTRSLQADSAVAAKKSRRSGDVAVEGLEVQLTLDGRYRKKEFLEVRELRRVTIPVAVFIFSHLVNLFPIGSFRRTQDIDYSVPSRPLFPFDRVDCLGMGN